jgi:hypothetical protein
MILPVPKHYVIKVHRGCGSKTSHILGADGQKRVCSLWLWDGPIAGMLQDNRAAFLSTQELENQPSYRNPATLLTYKNSTWLKYMLKFFLQKPKKTIKETW